MIGDDETEAVSFEIVPWNCSSSSQHPPAMAEIPPCHLVSRIERTVLFSMGYGMDRKLGSSVPDAAFVQMLRLIANLTPYAPLPRSGSLLETRYRSGEALFRMIPIKWGSYLSPPRCRRGLSQTRAVFNALVSPGDNYNDAEVSKEFVRGEKQCEARYFRPRHSAD